MGHSGRADGLSLPYLLCGTVLKDFDSSASCFGLSFLGFTGGFYLCALLALTAPGDVSAEVCEEYVPLES